MEVIKLEGSTVVLNSDLCPLASNFSFSLSSTLLDLQFATLDCIMKFIQPVDLCFLFCLLILVIL